MWPCRCQRGCKPLQHGVQRVDADVRAVVLVAEAARRCVGEQDVDRPGQPPLQAPDPAQQAGGAPVVLALAVLVGPGPVAHAPAEAGDPQPGGVERRSRRRCGSRPGAAARTASPRAGTARSGAGGRRRRRDRGCRGRTRPAVGHRGEELEVVPRQVAGREHEVRRERRRPSRPRARRTPRRRRRAPGPRRNHRQDRPGRRRLRGRRCRASASTTRSQNRAWSSVTATRVWQSAGSGPRRSATVIPAVSAPCSSTSSGARRVREHARVDHERDRARVVHRRRGEALQRAVGRRRRTPAGRRRTGPAPCRAPRSGRRPRAWPAPGG